MTPSLATDTSCETDLMVAEPADVLPIITDDSLLSPDPNRRPSPRALEREEILNLFSSEHLQWKNISWAILGWMVAIHIGALAAPFFFTWQAALTALALHWATCSIGICMYYHRCLSHKSLKLKQPARSLATLCGVLSGEGTPMTWAATHRVHHARSDLHGDPHSPLDGPWWSHLFWMLIKSTGRRQELIHKHYVPDLAQDRTLVMFERTYGWWLIGSGVVLYLIGGLPFLLWGLCLRMVVAYHSTWFVNSATHLWGYRNYKTTDESRNLWWVALMAYGEGWHNNHHAHPRLARAGHKWWEVDMTWWAISFLRRIGQATDVDDRLPGHSH